MGVGLAFMGASNYDKELTEKQNEWMFRLLYKYRKQLPNIYTNHQMNPLCTKKQPR
jgi:hypothetical protein